MRQKPGSLPCSQEHYHAVTGDMLMSIMRVAGKEHLSREEQMRIEGELEIHLAFPSFAWLSKLFQVCSVLCFFLVILLKDNTIILESSSTSDEFYDFPLICLRNASYPLNCRPVFAPSPSHTTKTFFFLLTFVWRAFPFSQSSVLF